MWHRKQKKEMVIHSEIFDCLAAGEHCPDMACFLDMYFSKNCFVKYLYVGSNGIFALLPCLDELQECVEEQERCRKALADIKEVLGLALYIYPVLAGTGRSYYAPDPFHPVELEDAEQFLNGLYHYTRANKTSPEQIAEAMEQLLLLSEAYEEEDTVSVLDENTLERILQVVVPMEGNDYPEDKIKRDEDGTEYILRDSDVMIGKINTGLVGKKEWYRLSDISPEAVLYSAVLGGCLGLHKLFTREYLHMALYIITGGFGGILPAVDALSICTGSYSYKEVNYYQEPNGTIFKRQEKVYLRRAAGVLRGITCMAAALVLGQLYVKFVYSGLLELLIALVTELGTNAGTVAYKHGIFIP